MTNARGPKTSAELRHLQERTEALLNENPYEIIVELEAEVARLKDLIDRDRTGLAAGLNEVKRTAAGWDWLCEGRGPYEYDDDRYRMEVGSMILKVVDVANAALKASGDRANEAFIPRARITAQCLAEECAKKGE